VEKLEEMMAENLWEMRRRRGMSTKQLAAKAGIPIATLISYEQGQPVKASDIGRLARALFVDEFAIKIRSDPKPEKEKPAPRQPAPQSDGPKEPKAKKEKEPPPPLMARPSQVEHLFGLGVALNMSREAVTAEVGQPLESLTLPEMKSWLGVYMKRVREYKESRGLAENDPNRPLDTIRKRAYLPEGVDEFELNYLTERQEQGDTLHFVLLNGETAAGKVTGFSPYSIFIQSEDGREMVLEKLALAYYYREGTT
jgi:transcriptional regulator with XRE-family HTH domain